jgi:hypothetical protein
MLDERNEFLEQCENGGEKKKSEQTQEDCSIQ